MTNPKHTDTSRRDELEKCFNLGDCAWTVRQAVRGYVARHLALIEALEAENERLNSLINATANHWLDLQHDHPIAWEGAVDTAMEAACDEIRRLSAALGDT